jgi:hypothetical protein
MTYSLKVITGGKRLGSYVAPHYYYGKHSVEGGAVTQSELRVYALYV